MRTLAVISRKGGSGKTTVAANLALQARESGMRTLLVDSDPQRSAALWFRTNRDTSLEVTESGAGKLFQTVLGARRDGYDLVVIDTPAHPEVDVAHAANLADLCVAVCRPTFLDIAAVLYSADMIGRLTRKGVVVINQVPAARRGDESATLRKAVEALSLTGLPYVGALSARVAYQRSMEQGFAASGWGRSPASEEVRRLWLAVLRHLEPSPAADGDDIPEFRKPELCASFAGS